MQRSGWHANQKVNIVVFHGVVHMNLLTYFFVSFLFNKYFYLISHFCYPFTTPGKRSKAPILSRNVDQKSIETVFSIVICRPSSDKWQSKTLFLSIFDPHSSIVNNVYTFTYKL